MYSKIHLRMPTHNRLKMTSFKYGVFPCRIRPFPRSKLRFHSLPLKLTDWFSPWCINAHKSISLMSVKFLGSLSNNFCCAHWVGHGYPINLSEHFIPLVKYNKSKYDVEIAKVSISNLNCHFEGKSRKWSLGWILGFLRNHPIYDFHNFSQK